MIARTLRLALVVALLGAWQNALLHPLGHLDSRGGFVHLAGGHAPYGSGKQGGSESLCDAIAAVGVCLGGAHALSLAAVDSLESLPAISGAAPHGASPLAYRSQAPPPLL
jgi:hypothetical protein